MIYACVQVTAISIHSVLIILKTTTIPIGQQQGLIERTSKAKVEEEESDFQGCCMGRASSSPRS